MTEAMAGISASVPLLEPPGWALAERELFDLARGTVVSEDGTRPMSDVVLPPQVAARLK